MNHVTPASPPVVDPHADETTRMIDVGGRRVAMTVSGRGTATVVLETGLGAESDEWATVQYGIARFARVVRYDRAGRGRSDQAPTPRTADDMVDDLRTLLCRAGIDGPHIVVGHSFGGLLARRYALRRRSEVAAIVLVDAMHEDQFTLFAPHFPPPTPEESPQLASLRAFWTGAWRDPRSTIEGIDFVASLDQGRQVESLGALPVRILSAGTFLAMPGVPPHKCADLQALWDSLQASYARLSSDVAHVRIAASGHFVQRDRPEAVIAAVEGLVSHESGRAGRSSVDPLYDPTNC